MNNETVNNNVIPGSTSMEPTKANRASTTNEEERVEHPHVISTLTGVGWGVLTVTLVLLLGPHINLAQTVISGVTVGLVTGLVIGILQWWGLRKLVKVKGVWMWIPATTLGWTLGTMMASAVIYSLSRSTEVYGLSALLRGFAAGAIAGLIIAGCQWVVIRNWVEKTRIWVTAIAAGTALSIPLGFLVAWLFAIVTSAIVGEEGWVITLIVGYLSGGIVSGMVVAAATDYALLRLKPINRASTSPTAAIS